MGLLFYVIFFASLIAKLIIGYYLPFSFDEAYYWVWSKHLQLSYFDHPGFVSWLFYLGSPFESWGGAARFPAIIFGHSALWLWYQILKPYLNQREFLIWLCLCLLSPLLGIGLIIITPDIPLLVFWSLSLLLILRGIETQKSLYYTLLGFSLGLGFCSKYHIVLFVLCTAIAIIFSEYIRKRIIYRYILYTFVGGFISSLPVLIWNYQNDFISFFFQVNHGFSNSKSWEWTWPLEYIGGQVLILSPLLVTSLYKSLKQGSMSIFHYYAWPIFLFFLLSSLKSSTEPNWPMVGQLSLLAVVTHQLSNNRGLFKYNLCYWITIYSIFFAAALNQWKWADKLREPYYYEPIYSIAAEYKPVYAESYQMASKLWFHYKKPFYKLKGMSRVDFFDFLPQSTPQEKTFYLIKEKYHELPDWITNKTHNVKELKVIQDRFEVLEISKI